MNTAARLDLLQREAGRAEAELDQALRQFCEARLGSHRERLARMRYRAAFAAYRNAFARWARAQAEANGLRWLEPVP